MNRTCNTYYKRHYQAENVTAISSNKQNWIIERPKPNKSEVPLYNKCLFSSDISGSAAPDIADELLQTSALFSHIEIHTLTRV